MAPVRAFLGSLWRAIHRRSYCLLHLGEGLDALETALVCRARDFYANHGLWIVTVRKPTIWRFLAAGSVLTAYGPTDVRPWILRFIPSLGVNPTRDALAAHAWQRVLDARYPVSRKELESSRRRFLAAIRRRRLTTDVVHIFGTGPSLDLASSLRLPESTRIVCNTIVKNAELLEQIQPHILVAGDSLYHFSDTAHAEQFRRDVVRCLRRHTPLFVYPAIYHRVVLKAVPPELHHLLIPVPQGSRTGFLPGLVSDFQLPRLGNVLNLLLIPCALAAGTRVYLLGFDGRAEGSEGFWRNSTANSYPDLLNVLAKEYPAFREFFVPTADPNRYVNQTLGEDLERNLKEAASAGMEFRLLAPSRLPGLISLPVASSDSQ